MIEYTILIFGAVLLFVGFVANIEYSFLGEEWNEYLISGVAVYILLLIALFFYLRKKTKEERVLDTLPDTRYTHGFER